MWISDSQGFQVHKIYKSYGLINASIIPYNRAFSTWQQEAVCYLQILENFQ